MASPRPGEVSSGTTVWFHILDGKFLCSAFLNFPRSQCTDVLLIPLAHWLRNTCLSTLAFSYSPFQTFSTRLMVHLKTSTLDRLAVDATQL